uniref:Putative 1-phosphatidylinositol 3-phosphate 5-kinase n=1 Tax=Bactrocera dorsalis TaxID=27457 RepID=A0A034VB90_BACDO
MNQHLHSPTKLTEFARDFEDEETESILDRFVNKIQNVYNQSYNTVNEVANSGADGVSPVQVSKPCLYADENIDATGNASISHQNSNSSINTLSINTNSPNKTNNLNKNIDKCCSTIKNKTIDESKNETEEQVLGLRNESSEGRTMVNVLKRMSNLMATKNRSTKL